MRIKGEMRKKQKDKSRGSRHNLCLIGFAGECRQSLFKPILHTGEYLLGEKRIYPKI